MTAKGRWNLLEEPWLDVSSHVGVWRRASPLDTLRSAVEIRAIGASSPLDEFAVLRFLATLLYWKSDAVGGNLELRRHLSRDGVPIAVIEALSAERDCFDLFHAEKPFLQDPAIDGKPDKPVGSLFAEIATGTNIAHFDHSKDLESPLCVPCVARGLLRLVPWSQSGGAGLTPSIHGAPPIAVIARGESLARTLALNLSDVDARMGSPTWTGTFQPRPFGARVPLLEALTWNPRRVLIPAPSEEARCGLCGEVGPSVRSICFRKNETVKKPTGDGGKKPAFDWRDPAFRYPPEAAEPIRSPNEANAAIGRDLAALAKAAGTAEDPAGGWTVVVPCTNPANNKTFDHRRVESASLSGLPTRRIDHTAADGVRLDDKPFRESSNRKPPPALARFLEAAISSLVEDDWLALRRAIGKAMHEEPAAFAIFSTIFWRIRDGIRPPLHRDAAWSLLKLVSLAPATARTLRCAGPVDPLLDALPARQAQRSRSEPSPLSPYPRSPLRGHQLELVLAHGIETELARGRDIPWLALGTFLHASARSPQPRR